jgi:hypothetical protein
VRIAARKHRSHGLRRDHAAALIHVAGGSELGGNPAQAQPTSFRASAGQTPCECATISGCSSPGDLCPLHLRKAAGQLADGARLLELGDGASSSSGSYTLERMSYSWPETA